MAYSDVSVAYTVVTATGIVTGLFFGGFVVDRIQRKSVIVSVACLSMCLACSILVLAIDGRLNGWVATVGFGVALGETQRRHTCQRSYTCQSKCPKGPLFSAFPRHFLGVSTTSMHFF